MGGSGRTDAKGTVLLASEKNPTKGVLFMASKKDIKNYYKDLPEEKRTYAEKLVDRLYFMERTLKNLEKEIREKGPMVEGKNGNGFTVVQENPAQKSYNTMIKNYNSTMKMLVDLLPGGIEDIGDEFTRFLDRA